MQETDIFSLFVFAAIGLFAWQTYHEIPPKIPDPKPIIETRSIPVESKECQALRAQVEFYQQALARRQEIMHLDTMIELQNLEDR